MCEYFICETVSGIIIGFLSIFFIIGVFGVIECMLEAAYFIRSRFRSTKNDMVCSRYVRPRRRRTDV